jgi:hypothetical protein
MFTCIICRFAQELDDVAVQRVGGAQCICLRCYGRETASARPMSKALREQVMAVLATADVAA